MGWLQERINRVATDDEHKLRVLGYKQEFVRGLTSFRTFGIILSYLSPITGLTGTYGYLWTYGGPLSIVWGWLLVSLANMIVGSVLAEICSAYPTNGGTYFWAHRLGGPRTRNLAAWLTGWFNILGQVGATAGVAYTSALLIADYIRLGTGGAAGAAAGVVLTQAHMLALYIGTLLVIGMLNTVSTKVLGVMGEVSVWWHLFAGAAFVILLPILAPVRQSAAYVFTTFQPDMVYSGITSTGFMFLLSLLGAQWAMVGYDSAGHLTEESQAADMSGPLSLIGTVVSGFVMGFVFLLSVTFSIQDPARVTALDNGVAGGNPVFGIVWDVFDRRYGNGLYSMALMVVPLLCSFACGAACVTACSRMLFAMARDGAVPLSRVWRQVNHRVEAPVNAVWCVVLLCIIIGLPILHSYVAFAAIVSIGVVGLYISYAIPCALRLMQHDSDFPRGPFHLGRLSKPFALLSVCWTLFACVLFILPQVLPVTAASLNYAPVAVGLVLLVSVGWWVVSARKWFSGPRRTIDEEEDPKAAIVAPHL